MNTPPFSATILVVEDEHSIRELLVELLEDEGYDVASAKNGREALTYLQQSSQLPRLILLDLNMPVMSGWEFRDKQQTDSTLRQIPVVVVSASTTIAQQRSTIHADGYVPKPIEYDTLINTVERYCTEC
jgi:CheY-like chemotaxis protein